MNKTIFECTDESDDRLRVVSRDDTSSCMFGIKHPDEIMSHLVEVPRSMIPELIAALQSTL